MSEERVASDKPKEVIHHVVLHKEKKVWYKHWWGVLVVICIWPFFLLWFTWRKATWAKPMKIGATILAALGIILYIALGSGGQSNPTTSSPAVQASTKKSVTGPAPTTASTPGLNQQANDGKLGFTVTSFQCGIGEIDQPGDTDGLESTSQGAPYCEMNLSVQGISTVSQSFDADSQYTYASGKQYSVDNDATIDVNDANSNCMLDPTVNPGTTITCTLVFDVPAGVTPAYATLHDSAFSGGVKVNL